MDRGKTLLFSTPLFLFAFLPLALIFVGRRQATRERQWALFIASATFYAFWSLRDAALITVSIAANYWFGRRIAESGAKFWLTAGIAFNLTLLGFFKYADFFTSTINSAGGWSIPLLGLALPLAISFYTFEQIGYLVECRQTREHDKDPLLYALFVLFFPHLIAGPIIRHRDIVPQLKRLGDVIDKRAFAQGVFLLVVGLFKKVVIADNIAPWADVVFNNPGELQFIDAWVGALAYTMQLYFDFSAYSELALGIGLMFGIQLPLNFNAPYKSPSITEFWRRWHMTLGSFLREYLYQPLGGNRNGWVRMFGALLATMFLGGLWHGAGWTFVIWGLLHGTMLVMHRAWTLRGWRMPTRLGVSVTFLAVVASWVLFRAHSIGDAVTIWRAMAGLSGFQMPHGLSFVLQSAPVAWFRFSSYGEGWELLPLAGLVYFVMSAPTVHEVWERWFQPSKRWAALITTVALMSFFSLAKPSTFLYFQF